VTLIYLYISFAMISKLILSRDCVYSVSKERERESQLLSFRVVIVYTFKVLL